MTERIVVTGRGVISCLGDNAEAIPMAAASDYQSQPELTWAEAQHLTCRAGFAILDFKPKDYLGKRNIRPLDRLAQLAVCATHLALLDSGWDEQALEQYDTGLILGTLYGGLETIVQFDRDALIDGPNYVMPMDFANTVINAAAGQTAIWHRLRGRNTTITAGCASGLMALAHAADLLSSGQIDRVLAGGAEALTESTQLGFDQAGLLLTSERPGFLLGEGAAFVCLERESDALAREANIIGVINGYASGFAATQEAYKNVLADTMQAAINQAGIQAQDLAIISRAGNGDALLDQAELQAIDACFAERPALTAIKFAIGETLGASGALQAASLLQNFDNGYGLVNAMGYDGNACSMVISNYYG